MSPIGSTDKLGRNKMDWYYSHDGQQMGPVSQEQIEQEIREGRILSDSLVWNESMTDWVPAFEAMPSIFSSSETEFAVCAVSGQRKPISQLLRYGDQYVSPDRKEEFVQSLQEGAVLKETPSANGHTYASPATRAKVTVILFIVGTAAEIMSSVTAFFGSDPENLDTFNWADVVTTLFAFLFIAAYLAGVVAYCMWKHRVCRNAHAMSNTALQFTPGWAVGFYFIPIVLLWKPFQAMKEIWNVTFEEGPLTGAPGIMVAWWTLWITSSFLGQISFRMAINGMHEAGLVVDSISCIVSLVMLFPILQIIRRITQRQIERAE